MKDKIKNKDIIIEKLKSKVDEAENMEERNEELQTKLKQKEANLHDTT